METNHSAVAGTWTDTGKRGGSVGLRDGKHSTIKSWDNGYVCYGCGATFSTNAELLTHLSGVHSAV